MSTTTSITEKIAALRTALADSKLEVTIGDATVRYKSNTELIVALEKLESIANVASTGKTGSKSRAVAGRRFI